MTTDLATPYKNRCFTYSHFSKHEIWINTGSMAEKGQQIPTHVPQLSAHFNNTDWPRLVEKLQASHQANGLNMLTTTCCLACLVPLCCTPVCWLQSKVSSYKAGVNKVLEEFAREYQLPPGSIRLDLGEQLEAANKLKREIPWEYVSYDSAGQPCVSQKDPQQPIWPPFGLNIVVDLQKVPLMRNEAFVQPPPTYAGGAPAQQTMAPPTGGAYPPASTLVAPGQQAQAGYQQMA